MIEQKIVLQPEPLLARTGNTKTYRMDR